MQQSVSQSEDLFSHLFSSQSVSQRFHVVVIIQGHKDHLKPAVFDNERNNQQNVPWFEATPLPSSVSLGTLLFLCVCAKTKKRKAFRFLIPPLMLRKFAPVTARVCCTDMLRQILAYLGAYRCSQKPHIRFIHASLAMCVTARPDVVNDTCVAVGFRHAVPSGRAIQGVLMLDGSSGLSGGNKTC